MKKFLLVTSAVFCAAVTIWFSLDYFLTDRYAVYFQPPYVYPIYSDPDPALLLKVDRNANALLLMARGRSEVFKFDSSTREVTRTEESEWNAFGPTETDCSKQLDLDEYSGDHYGHYFLSAKNSLDRQFMAVLSAYGPQGPGFSVMPNLGGPGIIFGTRYLEIRRVPDRERIGRPIRINISSSVGQPSLCWTPGSRYLVVHDQANSISVVDLQNR